MESKKKFTPNPPFRLHLKAFIICIIYSIILSFFLSIFFFVGIFGFIFMYSWASSEYKTAIKEGRNPEDAYFGGVVVALIILTTVAIILNFLL